MTKPATCPTCGSDKHEVRHVNDMGNWRPQAPPGTVETANYKPSCNDTWHDEEAIKQPTFDADGYPTDETLDVIREWPYGDYLALAEYAQKSWCFYGELILTPVVTVHGDTATKMLCITGGWSGNESIIHALMDNFGFSTTCWESTHRGGLVVFEIRKPKEG